MTYNLRWPRYFSPVPLVERDDIIAAIRELPLKIQLSQPTEDMNLQRTEH
jgi:hypothetical protein